MLGRLADALLYLCDPKFEEHQLFDYIQRKDLADFACISKESTIKLLMELSESGLIRLSGRSIEILDRNELVQLSNKG
jgi:CRP/FNR family transcriptional regulator